jgi:hypothetical protein
MFWRYRKEDQPLAFLVMVAGALFGIVATLTVLDRLDRLM